MFMRHIISCFFLGLSTLSAGLVESLIISQVLLSDVQAQAGAPLDFDAQPMAEILTGTWCGWCPESDLILDSIQAAYPNLIVLKVHNGADIMAFAECDELAEAYSNGSPSGMINRLKFSDQWNVGIPRDMWTTHFSTTIESYTPDFVLDGNVQWEGTEVYIQLKAMCTSCTPGSYRTNAYIVEDSIAGPSGSPYEQRNFFHTIAGHPFYNQGDPLTEYTHRNILRSMIGGVWGNAGVIPPAPITGTTYISYMHQEIPDEWNKENLSVILVVSSYDDSDIKNRPILAAKKIAVPNPYLTMNEPLELINSSITVFPNPAHGNDIFITIPFPTNEPTQYYIYNRMGQVIKNGRSYDGSINIEGIDTGIYLLYISDGKRSIITKFIRK